MANVQLTGSSIGSRSIPSLEGLRPSKVRVPLVGPLSIGLRQRSVRGLSVKAASVLSPKVVFSASTRKSVLVAAKKKKEDSHSFVSKPDEATGPFPEAVLLKEMKVQEDGRAIPEFVDAEEEKLFELLNLQLESDLDFDRIRHYEVVYLIHEDRVEEVPNVISKVEDFIKEKKGKIWRLSNWGLRRLAYKIKKAKKANYVLTNFEIEAKWINDFKSMLDKDDRVIRHLVIKRDEAITEDCPPPPEFHTLRAGMTEDDDEDEDEDEDEDIDEDEDEDEDIDEDEDEDEDGQDWDDETELAAANNGVNDEDSGIIYVDGEDTSDGPVSHGARKEVRRTTAKIVR